MSFPNIVNLRAAKQALDDIGGFLRQECSATIGVSTRESGWCQTVCTRPMNGPRVSALWVALFVMCRYSLIAHAQLGRSSAGSSSILEEGTAARFLAVSCRHGAAPERIMG
jgi:hypothetical protein